MKTTKATPRPLYMIAHEIGANWNKFSSGTELNFAAKEYLSAMASLNSINDNFGMDSGKEIVARFLCNASSWRGDTAERVKKELNAMLE
jgi:hypothetical protein